MKRIIYVLMILLILSFVSATHTLSFPAFMDVNESEGVNISSADITGQTAVLLLEGNATQFNRNTENTTFNLFLTSDKEIDLNYEILILNGSVVPTRLNHTNETQTNTITIADTMFYAFNRTENINETLGDIEGYESCVTIRTFQGTPTIKFFLGTNNGSETEFTFSEDHTPTSVLDVECDQIIKTYEKNYTAPFTQYFGFYCTDCDNTNKVRIATHQGIITNRSVTFVNATSSQVVDLTQNFIMYAFEVNNIILENYDGMFRFRTPFNLSVSLYNTINQTLSTHFDYVYLRKVIEGSTYSTLGASLSNSLLSPVSYFSSSADLKETFWGEVSENTAIIKLYEQGNYTITLLSMKTFMPGWGFEFIKPQYTSKKVSTLLDDKLIVDSELNQVVRVLLSEFEANKAGVIFNLVKWLFFLMLIIGGLVVAFVSDSPGKALAGLVIVLPIMYKLLGLTVT